jgi:hypothetical protein
VPTALEPGQQRFYRPRDKYEGRDLPWMQRKSGQPRVLIMHSLHDVVGSGLACAVAAEAKRRAQRNGVGSAANDAASHDKLGIFRCLEERGGSLE